MFNSLVDASRDSDINATTGSNKNRKLSPHLGASLYKRNIFVGSKLKNRIHSVGEYEGALNEDVSSATPYMRENYFFFQHRKFIQGFLDGLRQSNGKRYFQFTYIPSDKPKHPLANIDLLHDKQILPALQEALHQILEAQAESFDVKNYSEKTT